MTRTGARGLACVAFAFACSESKTAQTPADGAAVEEVPETAEPEPPAGPAPTTTCGTEGKAFETLDWIPPDARFALWIDANDPGVATAVKRLRDSGRAPGVAVPPTLALEFDHLATELTLVRMTLARIGLSPRTLVKIAGADGAPLWVWPMDCDVVEASRRGEEVWGVSFRQGVGARIGTSSGETPFAWDVLWLSGDRGALTQPGKAAAAVRWLRRLGGGTVLDDTPEQTPDERLAALPKAPVKLVLWGPRLMGEGEGAARPPNSIVASADQLWIDGTVVAEPHD